MDELVKRVATKMGLPEDKARMAVYMVVDYLKAKLAAPVADQIDSALRGGGSSGMGDIARNSDGLSGKK